MEGLGVARAGGERLLVVDLRLGEAAGLVVLDAGGDGAVGRRDWHGARRQRVERRAVHNRLADGVLAAASLPVLVLHPWKVSRERASWSGRAGRRTPSSPR